MTKGKKAGRSAPDLDGVIAGRVRPDARELVALIHRVNPTGLGLNPGEMARRYAQKSRLQSLLITRFRDDIEALAEPGEPGVVSLRHRPSGLDACHAMIVALDVDARSWVQRLVDMEATESRPPVGLDPPQRTRPIEDARSAGPLLREQPGSAPGSPERGEEEMGAPELLLAGAEAVRAFDFEAARARFEAAFGRSGGGAEAARALLSLLVDRLGADEDALAVEDSLSAEALDEPDVRALLAVAAARRSERERALRLLRTKQAPARRADPPPARAAEVFIALARGALAAGQLDEAAEALARARERDPGRPDLVDLSATLAEARASARAPDEEELARVFAGGDVAGAETRARELLARWPESDVGRRIARAVEELRRQEQARSHLASAREALDRGETALGLALLRRSLSSGLAGEEAAWAEQRIAALEGEARGREEIARVEEVRRMIDSGDLARGLPAYAGLDPAKRRALREATGSTHLLWLDQLTGQAAGAKVKAAVPAVLALARAAAIAARDPRAALDLLGAHASVVRGFGPAEEVRREARCLLAEQRRKEDLERIEAARRALSEGEPDRAAEILGEASMGELSGDERAGADALRVRITRTLERRALVDSIEQLRREGDSVRALGPLENLLARAEDADVPRLTELRAELRAEGRRQFCVRVDLLPEGGAEPSAGDALHDADISPERVWRMLGPIRLPGAPEREALLLVQARCEWTFLRVLDVASSRQMARVTLRSPAPLDLLAAEIVGGRLLLVGRSGALLEVSVEDFSVLRWCPSVLGVHANNRISVPGTSSVPDLLAETIEAVTISADGKALWLTVIVGARGGSSRHEIRVLDLDSLRLHRDIHQPRGKSGVVRHVPGLPTPRMIVLHPDDKGATLHDVRGAPPGDVLTTPPLAPDTITVSGSGERIFAVVVDPASPPDPSAATWGWIEITGRTASSIRPFEGVTAVHTITAVTSLDAGMTFVLFDMKQRSAELYGLREGGSGLEIAYRALLPRRAMLVGSPDSRRAAVVVLQDERVEIRPLGAEPPDVSAAVEPPRFCLPSVPLGSIYAKSLDCDRPSGARLTAVTAIRNALRRQPLHVTLHRLEVAQKRAGVDELLNLRDALFMNGEPSLARYMSDAAWRRFPSHPRARLSEARVVASMGQWRELLELMASIDPARLDQGDARHLHHLRGFAHMMLGEPEAALADVAQAASFKEGRCELDPLVAICTPLSDTSVAWTPDQARLRDLMAAVAAADAALERGAPVAAVRAVDRPIVWEAYEVQSFARLAEAYLQAGAEAFARESFRMALALLSFCALVDQRITLFRREMPLSRASFSSERLADVATRARARADEVLRQGDVFL